LPAAEPKPSELTRQLSEVMDGLFLDRAMFNPPASIKLDCATTLELGIYQNLKEKIMHSLLERNICRFDREKLAVTLKAELQVAGCQVVLLHMPQEVINESGYLDWEWKILPETSGLKLLRLRLAACVRFAENGEREKCLLSLDREVTIKNTHWFALQRFFKMNLFFRKNNGNSCSRR
jgi:hypothetical protein